MGGARKCAVNSPEQSERAVACPKAVRRPSEVQPTNHRNTTRQTRQTPLDQEPSRPDRYHLRIGIMCGIVGYIGEENALPVLLSSLERVTYRGYDSFGVAFTWASPTLPICSSISFFFLSRRDSYFLSEDSFMV